MSRFKKTVYKKDSKGKIRMTIISANEGVVTQESGLVGGALTVHTSKAKPKNVGKVNSTTPEQQAVIEAQAAVTKKLKEGYFNSAEEAENSKVIMPMLAKVFEKEMHKIDWETAYVQPKLDGMRCLDLPSGKLSRKNTPITTMNHIVVNRPDGTDYPVDGELYAHGLTFQENMKLIKKLRPESVRVQHHVYDLISEESFIKRYEILKEIVSLSTHLKLVPTYKVRNLNDVQNFHKQFLSEGFEGTMIRWGNEGYKVNGRSSNLLKYKEFLDETYEIIDIVPSDKNPEQGVIHCKMSKGNNTTFGCGMKFSHAEREEMLINKKEYIGKMAEVRFFEYTDDGIPRFPVCVGFREDK